MRTTKRDGRISGFFIAFLLLAAGGAARGATARGTVVDDKGLPIAGAAVLLRHEGVGSFSAETDSSGRFAISGTPPGLFRLDVERPGFAAVMILVEMPEGDAPGGESPGGDAETAFEPIRLPAGVPLEGTVTDAKGKPVEGAEVIARPEGTADVGPPPDPSRPRGAGSAVSAAGGRFRITDLRQGRFDVEARHPQLGLTRVQAVAAPSAKPLRLQLSPSPSLPGRVVDGKGAPIAGASITLHWTRVNEQKLEIPQLRPPRTTTDADGRFRLTDLDPGKHHLGVEAPGFTSQWLPVQIPEAGDAAPSRIVMEPGTFLEGRVSDGDGAPMRGADIQVHAGFSEELSLYGLASSDADGRYWIDSLRAAEAGLEIRPAGGPWLPRRTLTLTEGRNQLDLTLPKGVEVSGRAVDDKGRPVAEAQLELRLAEPDGPIDQLETRTAADGRFAFGPVAAGAYRLLAVKDGFAAAEISRVEVAAAPVRDLDLRFGHGAVIRGRILGLDPKDWQWTTVTAYSVETGWPANGVVRPDGTYRVPNVTPGPWKVEIWHPDWSPAESRVTVEPGRQEAVHDLRAGKPNPIP